MSVAFSPAALAFPHPSGQPSHSPPPPGAGTTGRAPVLGTTAPVTSILGSRVTRGGVGADSSDRAASERQAQQQAKGAAVDRRVRQLLDQSAPVFFSGTDILAFMPTAATATNADGTPSSAASGAPNDDIALGTPSFADRAVTPVSVLSNYAESSAARDLLLQTLTPSDRARLRDLHHRWRATAQRGIRTTHAVLFVCLQLGGDPPEHPRISPRAKLEAWVDASQESAKLVRRGAEAVIEALEGQYRALHRELSVRRHNEATIDDARAALQQMRRKAGAGNRMLVHYNGHGMPSITANGELWFFDARREHFVPFNIIDVSAFAQSPTVYVIDCNNAAAVISMWRQSVDPAHRESSRDVFLCACGEDQVLPTNPALPADFFTACLTTPLRAALLWYDQYSDRQPLLPSVDHTVIDRIPGDENNKRTPRGELAFILAAVADTVAWCTVEPFQFYALFRQDMLLRTLLRNFLIADRLMRETGCTPRSHPPLPYTAHLHPAWQSWEVALEGVLAQVPALLKDPTLKYVPSPYWRDQLTSFEVGLSVIGTNVAVVPEQLPCVVLALGQTAYRVRALLLLARYFEQGTRAVHHGLACGVVGYIVRLLQNREHSMPLLCIWMHVLRANPEVACAELVRAGAESLLVWAMSLTDNQCRLKPIKNTLEELPGPTPYVLASANRENAANSTTAAAAAAAVAASTTAGPRMSAGGASAAYADPNGSFFNNTTASAASPAPPPGMSQASFAGQSVNNPPLPQSAPHPSAPNPVTSYVSPSGLTLPMARTIAAFLLSSMVNAGAERTAAACWNAGVVNACLQLISDTTDVEGVSWGCLLLGRMCELLPTARRSVLLEAAYQHDVFGPLLSASNPAVRASTVNLLGKLLSIDIPSLEGEDRDRAVEVVTSILKHLLHELHGVSTEVRVETAVATLGFIFHQRDVLDERFYAAILSSIASGDFSAVVAMAASGPSSAVPVGSPTKGTDNGSGHPSPSTRSPSNNNNAAAAPAAALHFRVLETWRRVSVVSRLSAGGGPILSDAVDAGAGAASPNDRRALRLDCPPIAVPSSRSGATAAPPQQAAQGSSPPPPAEGASSPPQDQQRPSGNGPQPLSHGARTKLADLVHDAALMAHAAVKSIDVRLSAVAKDALRLMGPNSDPKPQCPKSNRIAREGNRLALSLDREARHTMSDAQRCAERRSLDLARQAVLRAEDTAAYLGRLGQQQQPSPNNGGALNTPAPSTSNLSPRDGPSLANPMPPAAGGTANSSASPTAPAPASMTAPGPTALQPFTLNTLANSHASDATVVAMALRELEPQMSSVDDQRVLTVTNYEKLRYPQVLAQLILPASIGHAAQLHVVNDMSSTPIALCVGTTGACVALHTHHVDPVSGSVLSQVPGDKPRAVDPFLTFYASSSAYSGGPGDATGGAGGGSAMSASSFAALTPTVAAGCPVASAYRNRDSLLFFAGVPNQIRRFSLAQEMLEQVLTVPGTGHITHLHATPTNEIFAGKDDGTVKIFDTRQHSGYWSFAGAVGDAPSSSGGGGGGGGARNGPQVSPRVVSVSRSESSPNDIIVAHRTCIKVYDARKRSAPKRTIDLSGPNASPSQLITAFEVSTQLPFMAATLADGTVIPMSLRGHQACEADIRVSAAPVGGMSAAAAGVSPQQSQARFGSTPSVPQTVTGGLSWRNGHVLAVHPHRPVIAVGKQMIALTPDESRLATALAL